MMDLLFSQEEITAIYEYNVRKGATEEGIQQSIGKTIAALKKFSINKGAIVQELMEQFHLTQKDTEEKVEQY